MPPLSPDEMAVLNALVDKHQQECNQHPEQAVDVAMRTAVVLIADRVGPSVPRICDVLQAACDAVKNTLHMLPNGELPRRSVQ